MTTRLGKSLVTAQRQLGRLDGVLYLLSQLLWRLTGDRVRIVKYHLLVQPIADGLGMPEHRGGRIEFIELDHDDPWLHQMGHPPETIAWRLNQGARCLIALKQGEMVGFLWWVVGPYDEDEVRCRFVPDPAGQAVWDFDVYVRQGYRGTAVFCALWDEASRRLHARGYRYSCSRISAFNPGSMAAHQRMGARVVGNRVFFCLGPLQITWGRQSPRFRVSLGSGERPIIRVGATN